MFELKTITKEAVPEALAKAERYRLLNEPREAESICRDVLRVVPDNQQARITLLLALTDQFGMGHGLGTEEAQQLLGKLEGEYERTYYAGVIAERWGKSRSRIGAPASVIHSWLRQAMDYFQRAEAIRPAGNDEAILRWNTCARIVSQGTTETASSGREPSDWDNPE